MVFVVILENRFLDPLTILLIPIPWLVIPDPGAVSPDPTQFFAIDPELLSCFGQVMVLMMFVGLFPNPFTFFTYDKLLIRKKFEAIFDLLGVMRFFPPSHLMACVTD